MNFLEVNNIFTLKELVSQNLLKKGDYVELPGRLRRYEIRSEASGCRAPQNFTFLPHMKINAKFTGDEDEENGYYKFIGKISFNVRFEGFKNNLQRKTTLDDLCKEMFGYPNYKIFSHSITNWDFEKYKNLILIQNAESPKSFYLEALEPELEIRRYCGYIVAIPCKSVETQLVVAYDSIIDQDFSQIHSVCPIIRIPDNLAFSYSNSIDNITTFQLMNSRLNISAS